MMKESIMNHNPGGSEVPVINPDLDISLMGTSDYSPRIQAQMYSAVLQQVYADDAPGYIMGVSFGEQPKPLSRPHKVSTAMQGFANTVTQMREAGTEWYVGTSILGDIPKPGSRGKKEDVRWITSLIMDVDTSDGVHKEENNPTPEEALEVIKSSPIPWTVIVHSGGGFHVYCSLDFPVDMYDTELRPLMLEVLAAWKQWCIDAFAKIGREVDSGVIADYTRVLRMPGSHNFKTTPAKDVTLFACRPDVSTYPGDILDLLGYSPMDKTVVEAREVAIKTHVAREFRTVQPGTIEWLQAKPGDRLNSIVSIGPLLEALGMGSTDGDVEGTGRWTMVDGDEGHADHAASYEPDEEYGVQTFTVFDTEAQKAWGFTDHNHRATAWTAVAALGYDGNYKAAARSVGNLLRDLLEEGRMEEAVTETADLIREAQALRAALKETS